MAAGRARIGTVAAGRARIGTVAAGRAGVGTVATLLAVAALSGCGGDPAGPPAERTTSAAASGVCGPEEHPPLQSGSHLIGDTPPPVPYSSVPPTSGWHASGLPEPGVHAQPLSDPEIVALLEIGQVVAVYDPAQLDEAAVATLAELGRQHPDRLSVTPSGGPLPSPLTLTAWGVLQRCEAPAADAVTTFVLTHYGRTEAEH